MSNTVCKQCNCKLKIHIKRLDVVVNIMQIHNPSIKNEYYLICNSCNTKEKIKEDDGDC